MRSKSRSRPEYRTQKNNIIEPDLYYILTDESNLIDQL